ncbi:uncharacterized protein E0L32_002492 [Thyridium curvatum]|uniref:UDP-galactose transporter n=1 Tax=Thyridium curvatum TaxID=1093900 RepID=A0A507B690_9PEZI|nr:uncharacterized protein E0L32_002492 [Thyridium curvatum]TPX18635.1 hypothetical protein E0L32_002492 [Thyridium curvatum]
MGVHLQGARPLDGPSFSGLSNLLRMASTSKRTMSQVLVSSIHGRLPLCNGNLSFADLSRASPQIVVQNSVLVAVMHRSRALPADPSKPRYLASTAILLVEITKLLVSLAIVTYTTAAKTPTATATDQQPSFSSLARRVARSLCTHDALLLVVPAALYTLQNFLIYVAISNMQAVAFQVTYQLKILTTVFFSILLLRRSISARQWVAMLLLTLGVAVVQVSQPGSGGGGGSAGAAAGAAWPSLVGLREWVTSALGGHPSTATTTTLEARGHVMVAPTAPHGLSGTSKGVLAAVGASVISGLTSVYFEKLVKDSLPTVSLWTRNAQLAFFSLFPAALVGVLWQDGAAVARDGFFAGYTPLVWAVIALQALGGMLVAMCVAYADNVAKNFAASLSIVVSCAIGALVFAEPVTPHSAFGIFAVLLATYLYQSRGSRPAREHLLPVSKDEEVIK